MSAQSLSPLQLELQPPLQPEVLLPDLLLLLGVGGHLPLVLGFTGLELSLESKDLLAECIDVVGQIGRCITVVEFVDCAGGGRLRHRLVQLNLEGPGTREVASGFRFTSLFGVNVRIRLLPPGGDEAVVRP